ncbi:DUF1858 domain-containing protein [Veillonella caviae]|uniref:DUF1858 domain-containing protein n=1 Tax=Veillonella caviae TaxID=248316 RepID=UPI0030B90D09
MVNVGESQATGNIGATANSGTQDATSVNTVAKESDDEALIIDANGAFTVDEKTTLSKLIKQSPEIVDYLISLNPKFEKLKSPMVKIMAKVATVEMIAQRADVDVHDLIRNIDAFINKK